MTWIPNTEKLPTLFHNKGTCQSRVHYVTITNSLQNVVMMSVYSDTEKKWAVPDGWNVLAWYQVPDPWKEKEA